MSKFNSTKESNTLTINKAGGKAYKESTKLEVATMLITAYLAGDKYYETEKQMIARLEQLYETLHGEDKQFLAKASIYARKEFRLRSISHLCSAIIAEGVVTDKYSLEDKKWVENYFAQVILRTDDLTETVSAYKSRPNAYKSAKGRIQLPNVMKRGLSRAIANYDEYKLAKYKAEGKETSLMDVIRMIHAKVTKFNREALGKLVKGLLKNVSTWEATQSNAGKAGADITDKAEKAKVVKEAKSQAWKDFVAKGDKIEYMALLKNLRNIVEQTDDETISTACNLLVKPELITKSMVLPFRYLQAYRALCNGYETNNTVQRALTKAIDISLSNCPKFSGKTAILLDISGSMSSRVSGENKNSMTEAVSCADIGALFAAVLYKNNDADVIRYNSNAEFFKGNPEDSVMTLTNQLRRTCGGTAITSAFAKLTKKYDRIIVLSDEQTWGDSKYYSYDSNNAKNPFREYRKKYNPDCALYNIDLAGYGTLMFPEKSVYTIGGFSEKVFDLMAKMEGDKSYLVHEIEKITL